MSSFLSSAEVIMHKGVCSLSPKSFARKLQIQLFRSSSGARSWLFRTQTSRYAEVKLNFFFLVTKHPRHCPLLPTTEPSGEEEPISSKAPKQPLLKPKPNTRFTNQPASPGGLRGGVPHQHQFYVCVCTFSGGKTFRYVHTNIIKLVCLALKESKEVLD